MDAFMQWTPTPLTLYNFEPFLVLLNGNDWGLRERDRQNDLTEFLSHILLPMAPTFVNNLWVPQPLLQHSLADTGLQDEKGHTSTGSHQILWP